MKAAKHPFAILRSTEYLIGLAFEDCYNSRTHVSSGGLGTPVNKTKETVLTMMLVADQIILPPKTVPVEPEMPNARMEPLLEPYTDAFNREMLTVQLLHTALEDIFYSVFWGPVDASQYATALRMSQKEKWSCANVVRIYLEPAAVHSSGSVVCYFGVGPKP
ncbi:hypothetical protein SPFM10_00281 [Salmonella phage SPFM10]|nr:hypothetical protein SPFM10_00281 [Salmonella phage SPFM10]